MANEINDKGFSILVAPDAFNSPDLYSSYGMTVNIYEKYINFKSTTKKYAYTCIDNDITSTLPVVANQTYCYGYKRNNVNYTLYTSSNPTPFIITDTERWVIVMNTSFTYSVVIPLTAKWAYLGNKVTSLSARNSFDIKYLHCSNPLVLTTIPLCGFGNASTLIGNVNIPKNVSSIGICTLELSPLLTDVFVDINNLYYSSLDKVLYNKTKTLAISSIVTKSGIYITPSTVTNISDECFFGCRITSIVFTNGVKVLGASICFNCNLLTSISIPNTITTVGTNMFQNCSNVVELYLENGYNAPSPNGYIFNFSNKLATTVAGRTALNQSILNITNGVKTVTLGSTNINNMINNGYPNFVTDAALRGLTII